MTLKQILVPVITIGDDQAALSVGSDLAEHFDGRVTALILSIWQGSEFAHSQSPLSEVLMDLVQGAQSAAALERAKIVAWVERSQRAFDMRDATAESALARDEIVADACVSDLIVLARPGLRSGLVVGNDEVRRQHDIAADAKSLTGLERPGQSRNLSRWPALARS